MSGTQPIQTFGLSKTYGHTMALVDLDLEVSAGEVFGYLGPNGAGKSTTIRLLLGLIRPTAGRATLHGREVRPGDVAARQDVGYLPGDLRLADRLTGREQLASFSRLRGTVDEKHRDELCARLEVELDRPIRQLSKGNRQKIGLVQAFMHRPALVVLDEPTGGLDPLLQAEVRSILRDTVADGRAVFISSHSLDEVQHVADRVGIIRNGRLIDVDAVESLRDRSLRHVTVTFAEPVAETVRAGLPGLDAAEADGRVLRVSCSESRMDGLLKSIAQHSVVDLVSQPADLEEIFLAMYREADDGR